MSLDDLIAMTPIVAIAGSAVAVMLAVAMRRHYVLTVALTLLGFLISLSVLPIAAELSPTQATPLILMDSTAVFFTGLMFFAGFAATLFAADYFQAFDEQREELYILILTASLGASVLVGSSHFASLFIGLEMLSVSLFAMIAYPLHNDAAREAGIKYLLLSGVSSAFLLFGMALVYAEAGSLFFPDLGSKMSDAGDQPFTLIGVIMIVVALGFKLSLAPFHMWTPDVYEGAPAPVTAFIATVSKGAVFAVLLRYFAASGAYGFDPLMPILVAIAVASILVGNLLALLQDNVKRTLAYSSIAHMGYILVAFITGANLGPAMAVEAVTFYLLAYIITTLGAFGVIAVLSSPEKEVQRIEAFTGLLWTRPVVGAIFTAMLLSLAGIPLTVGFVGKFYIFAVGVSSANWLLVWSVIVGSGIGLYYYLRIVMAMARTPAVQAFGRRRGHAGPFTLLALALLSLWFGIFPNGFMEWISEMAQSLG